MGASLNSRLEKSKKKEGHRQRQVAEADRGVPECHMGASHALVVDNQFWVGDLSTSSYRVSPPRIIGSIFTVVNRVYESGGRADCGSSECQMGASRARHARRGRLVSKAHRLLCHSTLDLRKMKKKRRR